MLTASTRLGPYEIVGPLGAGGMGEVYRARDTRLGREVAIKILPEPFAADPERRARFEREARAVAALSHPNILAIHDYGTHGIVTYAVMELLEGETLRVRLSKGPLPWREAVEIGAAIADGLAAAHAKGIVHRDLKPDNLFLTADGRMKILDFGLARVTPRVDPQAETGPPVPAETNPGAVMGTAGYMSPEQVRGQPVDARSDIFSFGCVLYEMVTGRRAFRRETAAETMTAILHEEPPDTTTSVQPLPAELGRIIRQCLAKSPNQRLQSARDLAIGLRAAASDPTLHRLPEARRFSWRLIGVSAAVLVIGVVCASVYLLTRSGNRPEVGKPAEESKVVEALAVLPFENVGGDPEAEHLSDGIPESIIKSLYEVRSLKVRPFSSVSRYKGRGKDLDLQEVGRQLEVQAVLTGKLTKHKDGLSLSVELVDLRNLSGIWIGQYDRKRTYIQRIPDEIAKQICVKLGLQLTGEEQKRLTKRYTDNPEAYQLYLKGRFFWNKRTREGLDKAIGYFRKATDSDPTYALAYSGLADVYAVYAVNTATRPSDSMPKAKAAATRALDIDDQLAEAYATLGLVAETYEWSWAESERLLKRAIELNPNYATAHQWYGQLLTGMGRFDEAEAEYRRALELDPLSLIINAIAGRHYYYAQRYDAAIQQYRKTLEMAPDFWVARFFLGRAYAANGMHAQALAELQAVREVSGDHTGVLSLMGQIYALMGRQAEARKVIAELKALEKERYVPPQDVAVVYASLGENEQALDWLEKAYAERSLGTHYLKFDPAWTGLRSHPRFIKLLQKVGLADKAAQREQDIHSVAVLPFQNVGGDPKTEFLSDGVADQIINSLSQVRRRDLKVRPFTSVARYKGKGLDIPTFGRELNVQMLVTGTLRQQGDDLAISVAVVDVREDNQLWGHTYRGKRGAILDLQDQIAREVAAKLRLQLTGEEEKRLTKRDTEDPEAYLLYREAVYHFNNLSPQSLETSIDYCRRAIRKDPKYALAHARLGRCYVALGSLHRGPKTTYPEARKHLMKALDIDANLADAHAALGVINLFLDWNWPEAQRELKQGIDLDSDMPSWNPSYYGFYLAAMGQVPEALAVTRRSQELDPLAAPPRNHLAQCYTWMRQYDRAIAESQKALELNPNYGFAYRDLGLGYSQTGLHEKAIAALQQGLKLTTGQPWIQGLLGYAYARAEQPAEARRVLDDLKGFAANGRWGCAFGIARIHGALGEKDQAFEWLRKACDERDPQVVWLKVDPTLDSLRTDPQFAQVLKDMGLPP
jgi:serine/threonine protein kinase/tetratricopeptide (TPR) repeat protein